MMPTPSVRADRTCTTRAMGVFSWAMGGWCVSEKDRAQGAQWYMVRGVPLLGGVGALLFDVLPITIGTSPLGQCHNLPLMTKMFLCGGACLYTAVTSSKIAREGLPSNGTSANSGGGVRRPWGKSPIAQINDFIAFNPCHPNQCPKNNIHGDTWLGSGETYFTFSVSYH